MARRFAPRHLVPAVLSIVAALVVLWQVGARESSESRARDPRPPSKTTPAPSSPSATSESSSTPTTTAPSSPPTTAAPSSTPTTAAPSSPPTTAAPSSPPTTAAPSSPPTTTAPSSPPSSPPTSPPADLLASVDTRGLPAEARAVIARIRDGGPFRYRQDGATFQNRERLLPARPRGYYREYTVDTPGSTDRGARRLVAGGDPPTELYYTDDHYRSFRRLEARR